MPKCLISHVFRLHLILRKSHTHAHITTCSTNSIMLLRSNSPNDFSQVRSIEFYITKNITLCSPVPICTDGVVLYRSDDRLCTTQVNKTRDIGRETDKYLMINLSISLCPVLFCSLHSKRNLGGESESTPEPGLLFFEWI